MNIISQNFKDVLKNKIKVIIAEISFEMQQKFYKK